MTTKPETLLTNRILKRLREERPGSFWHKTHGSIYSSGLPDIEGCCDGIYCGFEVKMPGEQPTPKQARTLLLIRLAGGIAAVVYSPEQAVSLLPVLQESADTSD